MATVINFPAIGDVSNGFSLNGAATVPHQVIWHGVDTPDDTEYLSTSSSGTTAYFRIPSMPRDFSAATNVRVYLRYNTAGKSGDMQAQVQLFESDGTTALTSATTFSYSLSATNVWSSLTITGGTSETAWSEGQVKISSTGSSGELRIYEMEIEVTYDETSVGGHCASSVPVLHVLGDGKGTTVDHVKGVKGTLFGSPNRVLTSRGPTYDFNSGTNSYLSIPADQKLSFGDGATDYPFSVSFWAYFTDMTSKAVLVKGGEGAVNNEYYVQFDASDQLLFGVRDPYEASTSVIRTSAMTSMENQWFHFVGTYDGTGAPDPLDGLKFYLDGESQTPAVSSTALRGDGYIAMSDTASPLHIGRSANGYDSGIIQDVRIWAHELSAGEAMSLYQETKRNPVPRKMFRTALQIPESGDGGEETTTSSNAVLLAFLFP